MDAEWAEWPAGIGASVGWSPATLVEAIADGLRAAEAICAQLASL